MTEEVRNFRECFDCSTMNAVCLLQFQGRASMDVSISASVIRSAERIARSSLSRHSERLQAIADNKNRLEQQLFITEPLVVYMNRICRKKRMVSGGICFFIRDTRNGSGSAKGTLLVTKEPSPVVVVGDICVL